MSNTHTRVLSVLSALAIFTLSVISASAQAPGSPQQPQQPLRPLQAQQPAQAAQIARGELLSVDATAKTLAIKPTEGAEQRFQYNDQTKVTGARGGVSGLATMSGRQVVVHFMPQGANRVATEIELQPDKQDK